MSTPQETATKLVEGTTEVVAGDNAYKAKVAAQIVDQLLGNDRLALVRGIPGIPPDLFEIISDGIVNALEQQVLRRLNTVAPFAAKPPMAPPRV